MHRTEGVNHTSNMFQDGPPGTRLEKEWLNAVQEEIAHVIEDAGIVLRTASTETRDQLLTAILALINVRGFFFSAMIKTSDYTVMPADDGKLILADATAGDIVISLLDPNIALDGFVMGIKKTDSSDNKVTLDPVGVAHIEGASNFDLMLPNGSVIIICNGTEYFLISLNEITNAMCTASLKSILIKAWVNFRGVGAVTIRDSFNVTSITDNGIGNYTITWDIDFANTDYCVVATCGINTEGETALIQNMATGSVQVFTDDPLGNNTDSSIVCVMAIGDQA